MKIKQDKQNEKKEKLKQIENQNKSITDFINDLPNAIKSFYKTNIDRMVSNIKKK